MVVPSMSKGNVKNALTVFDIVILYCAMLSYIMFISRDDNVIVCDNVTSSHFICNGTLGSVVHLLSVMSYICGTSVEDDGYAKNFNCPRCSLSCAP